MLRDLQDPRPQIIRIQPNESELSSHVYGLQIQKPRAGARISFYEPSGQGLWCCTQNRGKLTNKTHFTIVSPQKVVVKSLNVRSISIGHLGAFLSCDIYYTKILNNNIFFFHYIPKMYILTKRQ